MAHADFIHLRVHTAYSLSEGAIRIDDLVAMCVERRMPALAVTDTDNLFVCLSARHLNPALVVVVRAEGDAVVAKMRRAGADHVVSPNVTGAIWVASVLARPSVASFLGATAPGPQLSRHLEQVAVRPGARLAGATLAEARLPARTGMVVIALRKAGSGTEEIAFNPGADTTLEPGDDLIVMGTDDQIHKLRDCLS